MPRRDFLSAAVVLLLALICSHVQGDWKTDGGYFDLQTELGAGLPTGAGIVVLQTEADVDGSAATAFMPEASTTSPFSGSGNFSGKTFTVDSTLGDASSHAASVGTNFYGNSGSASPGITNVHSMLADDFLNTLAGGSVPTAFAGSVANHSWVGDSSGDTDTDNYVLRALDYIINRDGVVTCIPVNNDFSSTPTSAHPIFLSSAYDTLSVGLRNGQHSRGGTTADGTGRMKPDLVVDEVYTSLASPAVASTAAMLREKIKASYTAADNPQTIKAIILAGASKSRLLGWARETTATPYDAIFGAGELNVLNAYHILAKGRQQPSGSTEITSTGWDCNTSSSATAKSYFFTIPDHAYGATFSASLTWHRRVTRGGGSYGSSLADLNLKLYASNGYTVTPTPIDQSISTVDNVEHLFQRNLPPGQYALEVSSDTNSITFGLAWEVQFGAGPVLAVRKDADGTTHLDLSGLDPLATYTILQSTNLTTWTTATTVRTADTTPATTYTWQDTETPVPTAKFYKLSWSALR